MLLSHEDSESAHPYWYARVIGIYHALILHTGPESKNAQPQRMGFLHVRWFGLEESYRSGWNVRRLHQVCFLGSANPGAFGFINPSDVIRGLHLMPAFHYGRTKELHPPSTIRPEVDRDEDWVAFYVNIFVDRDMVMRYRGGGVGHHTVRKATNIFLEDRHATDTDPNAEDELETTDDTSPDQQEHSDEELEGDENEDSETETEDDDDEEGDGVGVGDVGDGEEEPEQALGYGAL
ncbi:hypothetical protein AX17_006931 [Amanita inopinata Kibby_2008]|nr:hypothetical protein AX17_006931 [Amanita inopinata Kibby_2008]